MKEVKTCRRCGWGVSLGEQESHKRECRPSDISAASPAPEDAAKVTTVDAYFVSPEYVAKIAPPAAAAKAGTVVGVIDQDGTLHAVPPAVLAPAPPAAARGYERKSSDEGRKELETWVRQSDLGVAAIWRTQAVLADLSAAERALSSSEAERDRLADALAQARIGVEERGAVIRRLGDERDAARSALSSSEARAAQMERERDRAAKDAGRSWLAWQGVKDALDAAEARAEAMREAVRGVGPAVAVLEVLNAENQRKPYTELSQTMRGTLPGAVAGLRALFAAAAVDHPARSISPALDAAASGARQGGSVNMETLVNFALRLGRVVAVSGTVAYVTYKHEPVLSGICLLAALWLTGTITKRSIEVEVTRRFDAGNGARGKEAGRG